MPIRTTRRAITSPLAPAETPIISVRKPAPPSKNSTGVYLLEVPFADRSVAQRAGARYDSKLGWVYRGQVLPPSLSLWAPKQYSMASWCQQDLLGAPEPTGRATKATGSYTLRPDQLLDVDKVLQARAAGAPEMLIAHDVGVGKTILCVAAIKRMEGVRRILVVCPLPVVPHWRRTIRDMGDDGRRWMVINYDSIKKLLEVPETARQAKSARTKNNRHAKQGIPKFQFDVVVRDESHNCADPSSQRSAALERIIVGPSKKMSTFIIDMSATAGATPAKLSYLHRGLSWRTGGQYKNTTSRDSYIHWCKSQKLSVEIDRWKKLSWIPNPAELETTRKLLFEGDTPWGIRRVPVGWPEQRRVPVPIEFSPAEQDLYQQAWDEFKSSMEGLANSKKKATGQQASRLQAQGMAAQLRYRQKAGRLRCAHTAAYAQQLLDNDHQVAISCEFLGSAEDIADRLRSSSNKIAMFTGVNTSTREDERISFQRGACNVIIFTPAEGFSLHAGETAVSGNTKPRSLVVAEPRWSPIKALQIEGRTQRDGNASIAYYPYAEDTIEQRVLQVVIAGMLSLKTMVGDDLHTMDALADALGVPMLVNG